MLPFTNAFNSGAISFAMISKFVPLSYRLFKITLRFGRFLQVTGMIERGQKITPPPPKKKSLGLPTKPQKIPGSKLTPKKSYAESPRLKVSQKVLYFISRRTMWPGWCGYFYPGALPRIFRLFWITKKKIPTSIKPHQKKKNTCQIFLPKKKLSESKISNTKKSFDRPITWNPEYPPLRSLSLMYIYITLRHK